MCEGQYIKRGGTNEETNSWDTDRWGSRVSSACCLCLSVSPARQQHSHSREPLACHFLKQVQWLGQVIIMVN